MSRQTKTSQLQIRVSDQEKKLIRRAAEASNQTISEWILNQLLPKPQRQLEELVTGIGAGSSYALAEINDYLNRLSASEINNLPAPNSFTRLDSYLQNYLAAMIEHAAYKKNCAPPPWLRTIEPLSEPRFGSNLKSIRLHLLLNAPPAFRKRNIFIDSSVGDRV